MSQTLDSDSIYNFLLWDNLTASSGQPDESQLETMQEQGVEWIINLGLRNTDYALADEAGLVAELGMRYRHIPVQWESPKLQDYTAFSETMLESEGSKRLIHCAANYRASVFVAMFFHLQHGHALDNVLGHLGSIWQPNRVWQSMIDKILENHSSKDP